MGQYAIARTVREFRDVIEPGQAKELTVFATAISQTSRRPTEPLVIRAIVEFQAEGQVWREILMTRD
jgi:hypothetical protein